MLGEAICKLEKSGIQVNLEYLKDHKQSHLMQAWIHSFSSVPSIVVGRFITRSIPLSRNELNLLRFLNQFFSISHDLQNPGYARPTITRIFPNKTSRPMPDVFNVSHHVMALKAFVRRNILFSNPLTFRVINDFVDDSFFHVTGLKLIEQQAVTT